MQWGIVYYQTRDGTVPADELLDGCPSKVEATLLAVLEAVRAAPPPAFSGGGKWEAMHGSMSGYYEIRVTGPGRRHYRLFCLLDNGTADELAQRGFDRPQIAVINGMVKSSPTPLCSPRPSTARTSATSATTISRAAPGGSPRSDGRQRWTLVVRGRGSAPSP